MAYAALVLVICVYIQCLCGFFPHKLFAMLLIHTRIVDAYEKSDPPAYGVAFVTLVHVIIAGLPLLRD